MRLPSTLGLVSLLTLMAASAFADTEGVGRIEGGVPAANPATGSPATNIDPDFKTRVIARGNDPLENPSGVFIKFGVLSDGTTHTEPDQNTYLVLDIIRAVRAPASIMDCTFCSRDTKTAAIRPTSRVS